MKKGSMRILSYFALVVLSLSLFFWGVVQAQGFLVPLSLAALLAMVILPVCRWFERKSIKRAWASLLSVLMIMSFFAGLVFLIGNQVGSLADDWPQIKERLAPKVDQLQNYIADKTGISVQEQDQKIEETVPGDSSDDAEAQREGNKDNNAPQDKSQEESKAKSQGSSGGDSSAMLKSAGNLLGKFFGFLGNFLLTFIYVFFFLLYRHKFRLSILKMVPEHQKEVADKILNKSTEVSQNYLSGRLILIIFLAILYAVGLGISGVQNAVLIALLAAVLSLIPYLGNVIGYVLAVGMALFSGTGATGVIGVSVTFAITQFIESYILEPYIVGDKVNLNPVVTIIVVVLGEAVWGIVGMLIAIPALGVLKVVFDNIPSLSPLGYLFGSEDISKEDDDDKDNFFSSVKRWALEKFKSS